ATDNLVTGSCHLGVDRVLALNQHLKSCNARGYRHWVACKRACLVYWAGRGKLLHYFLFACYCGYRKAVSKRLCKRCQIRLDAKEFACAAKFQAKACHYFVKYQHDVVLLGHLSHFVEVSLFRQHEADVCKHRLNDDAASITVLFNRSL